MATSIGIFFFSVGSHWNALNVQCKTRVLRKKPALLDAFSKDVLAFSCIWTANWNKITNSSYKTWSCIGKHSFFAYQFLHDLLDRTTSRGMWYNWISPIGQMFHTGKALFTACIYYLVCMYYLVAVAKEKNQIEKRASKQPQRLCRKALRYYLSSKIKEIPKQATELGMEHTYIKLLVTKYYDILKTVL